MKLSELKIKTPAELLELAQSLGIENISRAKKQTRLSYVGFIWQYANS